MTYAVMGEIQCRGTDRKETALNASMLMSGLANSNKVE